MTRRNLGARRSLLPRTRRVGRAFSALAAVSLLTGTVVDLFGLFGLASSGTVLAGGVIGLVGLAGLLPRGR